MKNYTEFSLRLWNLEFYEFGSWIFSFQTMDTFGPKSVLNIIFKTTFPLLSVGKWSPGYEFEPRGSCQSYQK